MARMSELHMEISERLREFQTPAKIARDLNVPLHWVTEIADEDEYVDYCAAQAAYYAEAEHQATLDALEYGMK